MLDGEVTTCPDCGQNIVILENGVAIDEDSDCEHECDGE